MHLWLFIYIYIYFFFGINTLKAIRLATHHLLKMNLSSIESQTKTQFVLLPHCMCNIDSIFFFSKFFIRPFVNYCSDLRSNIINKGKNCLFNKNSWIWSQWSQLGQGWFSKRFPGCGPSSPNDYKTNKNNW